jgi:hypothetical protein
MSTDSTNPPPSHVDEGAPLYIVHDEGGHALSHHRTEQGAKDAFKAYNAAGISETTLYR